MAPVRCQVWRLPIPFRRSTVPLLRRSGPTVRHTLFPQRFRWASPADPFLWDHDGDGYPDYATFNSAASASVSTRLSQPPYYENTYYWGTTGDRFVPGGYDGDGLSRPRRVAALRTRNLVRPI